MGNLSYIGLVIVPGQQTNADNLGMSFQSSIKNGMLNVVIRIAPMGQF